MSTNPLSSPKSASAASLSTDANTPPNTTRPPVQRPPASPSHAASTLSTAPQTPSDQGESENCLAMCWGKLVSFVSVVSKLFEALCSDLVAGQIREGFGNFFTGLGQYFGLVSKPEAFDLDLDNDDFLQPLFTVEKTVEKDEAQPSHGTPETSAQQPVPSPVTVTITHPPVAPVLVPAPALPAAPAVPQAAPVAPVLMPAPALPATPAQPSGAPSILTPARPTAPQANPIQNQGQKDVKSAPPMATPQRPHIPIDVAQSVRGQTEFVEGEQLQHWEFNYALSEQEAPAYQELIALLFKNYKVGTMNSFGSFFGTLGSLVNGTVNNLQKEIDRVKEIIGHVSPLILLARLFNGKLVVMNDRNEPASVDEIVDRLFLKASSPIRDGLLNFLLGNLEFAFQTKQLHVQEFADEMGVSSASVQGIINKHKLRGNPVEFIKYKEKPAFIDLKDRTGQKHWYRLIWSLMALKVTSPDLKAKLEQEISNLLK